MEKGKQLLALISVSKKIRQFGTRPLSTRDPECRIGSKWSSTDILSENKKCTWSKKENHNTRSQRYRMVYK